MCWEQYYAVGGALRHVDFNPTPGTLNCADFPASVSTAPVQCMEISLYPAYNVLSKMIYPDAGAAPRRDVHRRHQPVAGDHLPRHRPVGRALRLPAGRPDRRRDRRLLARRRHLHRRPGAHADLQAAERRAYRAELSRCCFYTEKKSPIPAAPASSAAACSAESCFIPHGTDKITHDTLSSGNADPDLDRHDGRLSGRGESIPLPEAIPTSSSA